MGVLITSVKGREILDSRGNPTLEVAVATKTHTARASVPSGASTGIHEALELRDNGKRYQGLGVRKAVRHVATLEKSLKGKSCVQQQQIDDLLLVLDGTPQKKKYGANTLLGISLAVARLGAAVKKQPLYRYLGKGRKHPIPFMNVINGGKHADNSLSFQEFMIVPHASTIAERIRIGAEVYHTLKKAIHQRYGQGSTNIGDEGGFAPASFKTVEEPLRILVKAIKDAGHTGKVKIAIDAAASEFYSKGKYLVDGKKLSAKALHALYVRLVKKYPIISLEDPFDQDDFASFQALQKELGKKILIVGDDLLVTNPERIVEAHEQKLCNALLLKVNQIGTLSEALYAARLAQRYKWKLIVSHRSGETEDTFIADLAVALNADYLKAGAPCRGERVAKYNQLLRI